jgi:hypothetical protein
VAAPTTITVDGSDEALLVPVDPNAPLTEEKKKRKKKKKVEPFEVEPLATTLEAADPAQSFFLQFLFFILFSK